MCAVYTVCVVYYAEVYSRKYAKSGHEFEHNTPYVAERRGGEPRRHASKEMTFSVKEESIHNITPNGGFLS